MTDHFRHGKLERSLSAALSGTMLKDWELCHQDYLVYCQRGGRTVFAFAHCPSQVPVGIHEDFFDLGGHSLSAMKLQAALKLKSEAEVTLADVLRARTPKRLAQMLLDAEAKLKQRQARPHKLVDSHSGASMHRGWKVSAPPLLPVSSNQPLASFAQDWSEHSLECKLGTELHRRRGCG